MNDITITHSYNNVITMQLHVYWWYLHHTIVQYLYCFIRLKNIATIRKFRHDLIADSTLIKLLCCIFKTLKYVSYLSICGMQEYISNISKLIFNFSVRIVYQLSLYSIIIRVKQISFTSGFEGKGRGRII